MKNSKKAQEEMVGFALIIIIVAVIMVVFLGFSLRNPPKANIENYEVDSFIQSFLQHTTDCRDNLEFLTVQKLIFDCISQESCIDGRNACEVLEVTLKGIADESWETQNARTIGYVLNITNEGEELLAIKKGNKTGNSQGSIQEFSRSGESVGIRFVAYS